MDDQTYQDTTSRLWNWGRWARSGSGCANGRCGSIEGRYLPERQPDEEGFKRAARVPIDVNDAIELEQAILALRGRRMRQLLIRRFADGWGKEELCRKLKVEVPLFEATLRRCVYEIRRALEQRHWWDVLRDRIRRRLAVGQPS